MSNVKVACIGWWLLGFVHFYFLVLSYWLVSLANQFTLVRALQWVLWLKCYHCHSSWDAKCIALVFQMVQPRQCTSFTAWDMVTLILLEVETKNFGPVHKLQSLRYHGYPHPAPEVGTENFSPVQCTSFLVWDIMVTLTLCERILAQGTSFTTWDIMVILIPALVMTKLVQWPSITHWTADCIGSMTSVATLEAT